MKLTFFSNPQKKPVHLSPKERAVYTTNWFLNGVPPSKSNDNIDFLNNRKPLIS